MLASYVHGAYIDDVVTMRRAVPQGGIPADWFFHSDDQFSVSAVTNAAGALAERVAYGDFGAPTFFTPGGTAMVASAIGNPYAFTGRRWDAAERTYHYRFRTFSPGLGRFTTRDPIGIWGDALNLGNGYTYTGNDPWSWVDPWGLVSFDFVESLGPEECTTKVSSARKSAHHGYFQKEDFSEEFRRIEEMLIETYQWDDSKFWTSKDDYYRWLAWQSLRQLKAAQLRGDLHLYYNEDDGGGHTDLGSSTRINLYLVASGNAVIVWKGIADADRNLDLTARGVSQFRSHHDVEFARKGLATLLHEGLHLEQIRDDKGPWLMFFLYHSDKSLDEDKKSYEREPYALGDWFDHLYLLKAKCESQ